MFLLVPQVKLPKRLDVTRAAAHWAAQLQSLQGIGLEAAVHDPLTEALWTCAGGVRKLWFDRAGHGTVRPITSPAHRHPHRSRPASRSRSRQWASS
jgi:hypothetical protein